MALGPDISPDLARKGLEADARNMLTGVAQGDTLSGSKRQLLLASIITGATPDELRAERVASLLLKFTRGARLSREEMAEIEHLVPSDTAAYSRALTEGAYQRSYKDYEKTYGKNARTIKWWVSQGKSREHPDLPPLDRPAEMPAWWGRVMKQRCPRSVEDAARAAAAKPEVTKADRPSPANPSAPPPPVKPGAVPIFETPQVTTQEQNLVHLKEQLARARYELLEEQDKDAPDQHRLEQKERKWRELRNEVDKAEEVVFKMRTKQGKLVDVEELGAQLLPMLVTTAEAFRSLITRLKPRLAECATEEERDAVWQAGVDECFTELIAAGFLKRETLQLTTA